MPYPVFVHRTFLSALHVLTASASQKVRRTVLSDHFRKRDAPGRAMQLRRQVGAHTAGNAHNLLAHRAAR